MVYTSGEGQVIGAQQEQGNAQEEQKPLVQDEQQQSQQSPDENAQQAQPGEQQKSEEIQALEQRLGYTTDDLGQQPQPQQEQPEQQQQQQQDSGLDEGMEKAIEQYFKQKFGLPPDQIQQQFQDLQQFKQQQLIKQQENALRTEWGDAFDDRIGEVKRYFNERLTDEQKQALDNADGARLIWAKIQQEQGQNQPNPPQYQSQQGQSPERRVQQPSTSYMYKKSQLDQMSLKEYNENIKNIEYAMLNGLVDYKS